MASNPMPLPPGATLVGDQPKLPPGATLVPNQGSYVGNKPVPSVTDAQSQILPTLGEAAKGIGKGFLSTLGNIDDYARKIPGIGEFLTTPVSGMPADQAIAQTKQLAQTNNDAQKVGAGVEKAAEFLIPGPAEANLAEKGYLGAGKALPIARTALSSLTAGAVNKAQGGSFTEGAQGGLIGGGLGEAARGIAPIVAEKALGIRGTDRLYGRTPGEAIIEDTTGVRPSTVQKSAQAKLSELNPQLEGMADAVSSKPATPVRGLLQAPQKEIPLNAPTAKSPKSGGLYSAETKELSEPAIGPQYPAAGSIPSHGEEVGTTGNQYGSNRYTHGEPNPQYLSGSEHPELAGRYAPPNGTLISREAEGGRPAVDEFGRIAAPKEFPYQPPSLMQPNRVASLTPARSVVGGARGTAAREGAQDVFNELGPQTEALQGNRVTGEQYPDSITPRQLLDVRRGFNKDFIGRWNPNSTSSATNTAKGAYGALTNEFHNVVPGSQDLDQRISSLIPVADRAAQTSAKDGIIPQVIDRFAKPTGALLGGVEGYRLGGLPGAAVGLVAPLVVSSPTTGMVAARTLAKPTIPAKLLTGSALQLNRKASDDNQ